MDVRMLAVDLNDLFKALGIMLHMQLVDRGEMQNYLDPGWLFAWRLDMDVGSNDPLHRIRPLLNVFKSICGKYVDLSICIL